MEELAGVAVVLVAPGLGAVKKDVMLAFAFGFLADAAARSAALRLSGVVILRRDDGYFKGLGGDRTMM